MDCCGFYLVHTLSIYGEIKGGECSPFFGLKYSRIRNGFGVLPCLAKAPAQKFVCQFRRFGCVQCSNILGLVCSALNYSKIPGEIAPHQTKKLNRHKQLVES